MQLWSIARFDLRLTAEEFYDLTPRQFHALTLRSKEAREHTELLFGINTAAVVNTAFNPPKRAKTPFDFMPTRRAEADSQNGGKQAAKRFNRQKFANEIRSVMRALPSGWVRFKNQAQPAEKES